MDEPGVSTKYVSIEDTRGGVKAVALLARASCGDLDKSLLKAGFANGALPQEPSFNVCLEKQRRLDRIGDWHTSRQLKAARIQRLYCRQHFADVQH